MLYHAENVELKADIDYGEGYITFQWPDQFSGWECLKIDLEGYCSRRMPIRSGNGWPEFVEMQRDRIKMRFDAALAAKLELEQDIETAIPGGGLISDRGHPIESDRNGVRADLLIRTRE